MRRPAPFARPADAAFGPWFARLAEWLINHAEFVVAGRPWRLTEVEGYEHSPAHPDPFAHRDPVQEFMGRWYFHRTHGAYRGGSYKGIDLAVGAPGAFGGLLFRGALLPDGSTVDGPSLLVDAILNATGFATVAALDAVLSQTLAWDAAAPVHVRARPEPWPERWPLLATPRVGMSLKRQLDAAKLPVALDYLPRPYRFLGQAARTRKGRVLMVAALLEAGESAAPIATRLGAALRVVEGYERAWREGAAASAEDAEAWHLSTRPHDLARLLGWLSARRGEPPGG